MFSIGLIILYNVRKAYFLMIEYGAQLISSYLCQLAILYLFLPDSNEEKLAIKIVKALISTRRQGGL